jgi:purine-nucleoside phosphorylase
MSSCYDKELIQIAESCAKELGFELKKGIYSFSKGPMFETPAEIRALRIMGADAVGMSTVPEAITANHMSMRILAVSCITNMAAGILKQPLTHEEVILTAKTVEKRFSALLGEVIKRWE